MKKKSLLSLLLLVSMSAFCKTWTVTNSGANFEPAAVIITLGDTVRFVLGNTHDAIEVGQEAWEAEENIPLTGGFKTAKGGGTVLPLQLGPGTHYYICGPHITIGMKGMIIVQDATSISENRIPQPLSLFPNPATTFLSVKMAVAGTGETYTITDGAGRQVLTGKLEDTETPINIGGLASGFYFFQTGSQKRQVFTIINN